MMTSLPLAEMIHDRLQRRSAVGQVVARLLLGNIAWRQRRQLARLDAHALADIGVSPDQALAEAARPIWDVPRSWLV